MRNHLENRLQRVKDHAYLASALAAIPSVYFLSRASKIGIKVTDPEAVTRAKIHRNGNFVQMLTRKGAFETVLHHGETLTGTLGGENVHLEDYPVGKAHSGKAIARIGGRTYEYIKASKDLVIEKTIFKTRCAWRIPLPAGKTEVVGKQSQIELTYTQPETPAEPEPIRHRLHRRLRRTSSRHQAFAK